MNIHIYLCYIHKITELTADARSSFRFNIWITYLNRNVCRKSESPPIPYRVSPPSSDDGEQTTNERRSRPSTSARRRPLSMAFPENLGFYAAQNRFAFHARRPMFGPPGALGFPPVHVGLHPPPFAPMYRPRHPMYKSAANLTENDQKHESVPYSAAYVPPPPPYFYPIRPCFRPI